MPSRARAERTAREIQARRALGERKRRRKVLPRQIEPRGIELEYTRRLLRIVAQAQETLRPLLDELPELVKSSIQEQERLDVGEAARVQALTEIGETALSASLNPAVLDALAIEFAQKTATWQRRQLLRQTRAAFGVDLLASDPPAMQAAIEGFRAGNRGLMRDLGRKTVSDLEGTIQRGLQRGTLHSQLAKEIEQSLVKNRNRARLIARDQVGKFYGKVNKVRQEAIGVTHFKWRTSSDERVRDEHVALEGLTFTWAKGAGSEGIPGEPVNCRCFGEPVLDEILAG